ncbi:long-chain-fatty-acid--CoA ligase 4 [Octopus bimaculoides]|uniref:long-chain-fatty-acid--CoA ligase n=1 Tax=Octopus bimaculoides TaxID=37653 RepID=A0A0L8IJ23_OCTBM|nr:long-chain-fatty-acid--CoA ligase 4 [Octopus bimaculoides]XP_014785084.1 long-chain-fatty-acid--CoA ligase 4 [Octopus bimaculoides]XP_014785816.1 long-chain-fatty-acid--CoA ligase 4 [Octopus bimaculoides]XP_014786588.1 long-chain-fatty-acid--CoA ligase 4 [Octopus bimaculoides]XP_014787347.1 long-chain-fatty-acid--CoA ligase 4 [Octopus bimaculoides]|eukprot:XP_014784334.1 PREDICTED: long-chain-fatty-acid--CoA ligase 4-like [Octopus bimaculoides]
MNDVFFSIIFGFFKAIVHLYGVVTFIPYYLVCKPAEKLKASSRIKARSVHGTPDSPYRSVDCPGGELTTALFQDECVTVDDLFCRAVKLYGPRPCLGTREVLSVEDEVQQNGRVFKKLIMGEYNFSTFNKVSEQIHCLGRGLLELGLKPRDHVLIFSETRAEWMIIAQMCLAYNFPLVTLYSTLGEKAIVHGINESEVNVVFTSATLLPKVKNVLSRVSKVNRLVYMADQKKIPSHDISPSVSINSLSEVIDIGSKVSPNDSKPLKPQKNDIAVMMYTSGSTGRPKGVLISHANLMAGMSGQCSRIPNLGPHDTYIGYLPLAHVLEFTAELSCLAHGTCIGYSSALTLTDKSSKIKRGCQGDASKLKPTLMAAVPLIMDRLYKSVWDNINSQGKLTKAIFEFAYTYKRHSIDNGYDTLIFNRIFFKKVQAILGGNVRLMLSGGAPLSEATQKFMNICFCCPVGQGYGLTETCGAGTITEVTDLSVGSVGAPLTCCEIKLRDWPEGGYLASDKPNPRGEILVGGGNIAQGYYKYEEKTKEDFITINGVNYFCTGDIGEFKPDGSLKVIDRKKDLVKLQAGEYVSLSKVETILKMSSLVDQICVYANSFHNFIVCLIVPNQKNLCKVASEIGLNGMNFKDLCKEPKLLKEVQKIIHDFGIKSSLERCEIPTKICLCPDSWMPDSGLVTDAFKLKRKNLEEKFQTEINAMYGSS